jgi:hypothetical protein
VGTTYLTGTLTTLVSSLVTPGAKTRFKLRRFGVLIALAAGAALSGLLIKTAASAAPALPLVALALALLLAWAPAARWPSRRRRDRGSLPSLWRLSHGLRGVRAGPGAGVVGRGGQKPQMAIKLALPGLLDAGSNRFAGTPGPSRHTSPISVEDSGSMVDPVHYSAPKTPLSP